ncbi:hypothetical protein EMN47_19535 [Prolixibacteraceae bacterium JC049]|nr:hypothetical protein [Prolixibacteraceae bacterium JC049]
MYKWITIKAFTLPQDAQMAKTFLESYEIEVQLQDELTTQVNNLYSNLIGGVKFQVKENQLNQAVELMKEGGYIQAGDLAEPEVELLDKKAYTDQSVCPFCKSKNIAERKEPNALTAFVFLLLSVFIPIFKRTLVCFDCNKRWKYVKIKNTPKS